MSTNPKSAIQNLSSTSTGDPKSKIPNPKFEYGFTVASYDKAHDLIIDPLLASTYLGASGNGFGTDYGKSIVINPDGSIYVTGYTSSSDFPTPTDAYDTSYNNDNGGYDATDIFISKMSGDLTNLLASTYLGGSDTDYGNSIAIDSSGNVFVTGYTKSSDFPTTTEAYNTSYDDYYDVFVSKLNGDLTSLLASTYLGGTSSDADYGNSIAIDSSGNIYVAGTTWSSNFPITTGSYDISDDDNGDAFVSKLNNNLTSLLASTCLEGSYGNFIVMDSSGSVYVTGVRGSDVFVFRLDGDLTNLLASTYLGGIYEDAGVAITIGSDGNVYVTGYTESPDFPITKNAYDTSYNSGSGGDTFVLKLNGTLTSLLASTYLGGSKEDIGNSIAIDSSGNVYVAGYTESSDFPTTTEAYNTSYNDDYYEVFVSKLNGDLTSLLASTYLGGSDSDYGNSIAIDADNNIYVTGNTSSSNFPITTSAYDVTYNGGYDGDAFVSMLNGELTSLIASTYLGGTRYNDYGNSIVTDSYGNVYIAGYTNSSNFLVTTDSYDVSYNGDSDVLVSKLNKDLTSLLASTYLGGSEEDFGNSIAIDSGGNIYVSGYTSSSDFPTTAGAHNISSNISFGDVFISKLNGDLTNLIASTYTGEINDFDDNNGSIAIDSNGNIFLLLYTGSVIGDFPDGTVEYYYFFNVSKFNDNLTNELAYYSGYSYARGIAVNSNGNVYVVGGDSVLKLNNDLTNVIESISLDGTADSLAINSDGSVYVSGVNFISKLSSDLMDIIASYKFQSHDDSYEYSHEIAIDSNENVYVADKTSVLKLDGDLTKVLASASLDGVVNSLAIGYDGNIYVTGYTGSSDFTVTAGAYDTSNAGDYDAFVSKFDSNLSSTSPTVTTGAATDIKSTSATLNGSVNANGASTDVWFEYDTTSGSYSNTTSTQSLNGLNGTDTVSIDLSGLSPETTYYYRVAGQNSVGISYGSETSFTTNTPSPPTVITGSATSVTNNSANLNGTVNANEFLTTAWFEYGKDSGSYSNTSSTTSVSGSDNLEIRIAISSLSPEITYYYRLAAQNSVGIAYGNEMSFTTLSLSKGNISGYVSDIKGNPIESVKLMLKGKKTKIVMTSFSNSDGFFEFTDLDADTYVITATKKGYKRAKRSIKLEEGEVKEIEIVMKKTSKRVR